MARFKLSSDSDIENRLSTSSLLNDISSLENIAITAILEKAVDKIIVLGNAGLTRERHGRFSIDNLKNRAAIYLKNDPVYNCHNGESFAMTLQKKKVAKLNNDRNILLEILIRTKEELFEYNTYNQLTDFIDEHKMAKEEENTLIEEQTHNKTFMSTMKQTLNNQIEENKREIINSNNQISTCKDEVEKFLFENAIKMRYLQKWESARTEQGCMTCDLTEKELRDIIDKNRNEIEKEIRINSEIQTYIAENQRDMEEEIDYWTKRYNSELEDKQMQIQLYKDKREEQMKRYNVMLETYNNHRKDIEEWLDYKEKKRIKDELDKLQKNAATRIQAWWRGMMFRHGLGPWNPEQNTKKKKKKDKKKGKKKK